MTESYREYDAINFSVLKAMKSSPADYKVASLHQPEQTDSMLLGSIVHMGLLEPEKLLNTYHALPEGLDRRTKAGKEAYQNAIEASNGKKIVPWAMWERAEKIIQYNENKPLLKKILSGKEEVEKEMYQTCKATGLKIKGMADLVTSKALVDIKTTSNFGGLKYNIKKYSYDNQLAFYDYLLRLEGQLKSKRYLLFIETNSPYKMALVEMSPELIKEKHEENIDLLLKVKACQMNDSWPDNSDTVFFMDADPERSYEYQLQGS